MDKSKKFMKKAVTRPGAFSAKAKKAGKSTSAYATEIIKKLKGKKNTPAQARTLKQAVLAKTFKKYRPK